jgi:hypothetical protein
MSLQMRAEIRHANAHCGSCGEALFGAVPYCPYCGRPSASAPVAPVLDPPIEVQFAPASDHAAASASSRRRGTGWQPIAMATLLALAVLAAGGLALAVRDKAGPAGNGAPGGDAARAGTSEPGVRAASSPASDVLRAAMEPPAPQQAAAPPPPRRSLCSAASEAAGLCNPQ